MQQQLTPTVGETVISSDGEILGDVKEVRGGHFKVDVSLARDYWLNCSDVSVIEQGAVCLTFPKSELDSHKQREPGQESAA